LGSDTATSFFLLCKVSLTKLFEIHRWSWTSDVHYFISASRLEVVTSFSDRPSSGYGCYRLRRPLYTLKYAMKWYTSTN